MKVLLDRSAYKLSEILNGFFEEVTGKFESQSVEDLGESEIISKLSKLGTNRIHLRDKSCSVTNYGYEGKQRITVVGKGILVERNDIFEGELTSTVRDIIPQILTIDDIAKAYKVREVDCGTSNDEIDVTGESLRERSEGVVYSVTDVTIQTEDIIQPTKSTLSIASCSSINSEKSSSSFKQKIKSLFMRHKPVEEEKSNLEGERKTDLEEEVGITDQKTKTLSDLFDEIPKRTENDTAVVITNMWIIYTNYKMNVTFSRVREVGGNNRMTVGHGVKPIVGGYTDFRVNILKKKNWNVLHGEFVGYYKTYKNKIYVLQVIISSNILGDFKNVLRLSEEKKRVRIGVEFCEAQNVVLLSEIVDEIDGRVCIYTYREENYNTLVKAFNTTRVALAVFPKLTRGECGVSAMPDFLPVGDAQNNMINSMIEFKHVTAEADSFNAREYQDILVNLVRSDNTVSESELETLIKRGYNSFFQEAKRFYKELPPDKKYSYGFADSMYVKWLDGEGKFDTTAKYVMVSRKTETMLNQDILLNIYRIRLNKIVLPKINWVNAPPGCGKTTFILREHVPPNAENGRSDDLVLSITKDGKTQFARRAVEEFEVMKIRTSDHYRTVASLLVNACDRSFKWVFIHDHLMMHAGAIGYVAALTGAEEMILIGDKNQIPFVDRDHIISLQYEHPSVFCDVTTTLKYSYRCPIDVVYTLRDIYPGIYIKNVRTNTMRVEP